MARHAISGSESKDKETRLLSTRLFDTAISATRSISPSSRRSRSLLFSGLEAMWVVLPSCSPPCCPKLSRSWWGNAKRLLAARPVIREA